MARSAPPDPPAPEGNAAPGASATPLPCRRRALVITAGVVAGCVGAAALVPPRGEPAAPARPTERPRVPLFVAQLFSLEQALLVEDLAELIIPETNSPGAVQAGVPAFIEGIVREVYDEPERLAFLRGIDELNA